MRPKFLLDEHISRRVAERSRAERVDVHAVDGSGLVGFDDEGLLRQAIQERRLMVTYNIADFAVAYGKLLKEGLEIPGIVFVDNASIPSADIGGLVKALVRLSEKIDRGEETAAGGLFLNP